MAEGIAITNGEIAPADGTKEGNASKAPLENRLFREFSGLDSHKLPAMLESTMQFTPLLLATTCALSLGASGAFAQATNTPTVASPAAPSSATNAPATTAPAVSAADKHFLHAASQGGLFEIAVGNYAAQNGNSSAVKDLGTHTAADHTAINQKVGAWAESQSVKLSDKPNTKTQAKIDKLTALTGADFDKAYVDALVKAHKADIAAFQKEIDSTSNADLKALLTDTLPTLQGHLKMAEDAQAGLAK